MVHYWTAPTRHTHFLLEKLISHSPSKMGMRWCKDTTYTFCRGFKRLLNEKSNKETLTDIGSEFHKQKSPNSIIKNIHIYINTLYNKTAQNFLSDTHTALLRLLGLHEESSHALSKDKLQQTI